MEYVAADFDLPSTEGLNGRLLCFLCLLVSGLGLAAGAKYKDPGQPRIQLEAAVAGLCFVVCAASCTLLTDSAMKVRLSMGSCGSSLMVLLAPQILQRTAKTQSGERSQQDGCCLPAVDSSEHCRKPKLRSAHAPKSQKFDSELQVIREDVVLSMDACKGFEASKVSPEKSSMILAAVYTLAMSRQCWGKQPDATWGKFLANLDGILTGNTTQLDLPNQDWHAISCWCGGYSPRKLKAMISASIKMHSMPGEKAVWRLARILDESLVAAPVPSEPHGDVMV
mmetsp:Transcript_9628/g.17877  ORF Transcript_9628/g.17877 Transcript_9628/m.17877 type:complete len:281 (+) Transcript_9628:78-920(+)